VKSGLIQGCPHRERAGQIILSPKMAKAGYFDDIKIWNAGPAKP
jgi:hypothetical protein